jgi:hypothetical protein
MQVPVTRHWQLKVQVDVLQEKMNGQVPQSMSQLCLSAAQSRVQGQAFGHEVLTPSQRTYPRWPAEQFWSTFEHELLPLQLIGLPDPQLAEAVQRALPPRGWAATGSGAVGWGDGARVARKA